MNKVLTLIFLISFANQLFAQKYIDYAYEQLMEAKSLPERAIVADEVDAILIAKIAVIAQYGENIFEQLAAILAVNKKENYFVYTSTNKSGKQSVNGIEVYVEGFSIGVIIQKRDGKVVSVMRF